MKHLFFNFCLWCCDVYSEWTFSLINMPHNSCKKKKSPIHSRQSIWIKKKKSLKTIPPCILWAHSVHLPKICFSVTTILKLCTITWVEFDNAQQINLLIPVFGLPSRGRHGLICMCMPLLISNNTPVAGIHTWC